MFLKQLVIQSKNEVIRDISFHKGINLIVDETPENETQQTTGNNVGKTTVLRLVDFCLGGDGQNIYKDTEFKKQPNTIVEKFLKDKEILITVILVSDIDNEYSEEIVISRNFLTHKKKIQDVNGERIIDDKKFDKRLKELVFKSEIDKPTFRQIISKNIRDEKNKMTNIVKVLNPYTRPEEYEALYLFWLGLEFNDISEKYRLSEEKKVEERIQRHLLRENSLSMIIPELSFVIGRIEKLNQEKNLFNSDESYISEIESLNNIKFQLNKKSAELSRLEMKRDLICESKADLEREYARIDTAQIKTLYEKAKSYIPDIQVSFEDTVQFHNDLVSEKLEYITGELPDLEQHIKTLKSGLFNLRKEEDSLTVKLQKLSVAEELTKIVTELTNLSERKGQLEEQKKMWEDSQTRLEKINAELKEINDGIASEDNLIQNRITEFNKYFSNMSYKLYGEYYLLGSQKSNKGYDLIVKNFVGNPSTGKKKGQIAAFDFAYIEFADNLDIPCLHFIMHDQLENVHHNQLNTLIDVANSLNGQYIVPILRDKIPTNVDVDSFEVLSLSQDNKLFRI